MLNQSFLVDPNGSRRLSMFPVERWWEPLLVSLLLIVIFASGVVGARVESYYEKVDFQRVIDYVSEVCG
jgi:hypothetical protein